MKHFYKLLLRSMIIAPIIVMQQCKSMEHDTDPYLAKHKEQNIHIYLLISSLKDSATLWLSTDAIRYISSKTHFISKFLCDNNFYCNTHSNIFNTTFTLNYQRYSQPSIQTLLKICLTCNGKKSLLNIKNEDNCTVFDITYDSSLVYKSILRILCSIVDRKEFVDHFKKSGIIVQTNFHRMIYKPSPPGIIALYLDVLLDYAQDCPKKSKEVLELFTIKDICGYTVLDIAKRDRNSTIHGMLKETVKKLLCNTKKKDNCMIQ